LTQPRVTTYKIDTESEILGLKYLQASIGHILTSKTSLTPLRIINISSNVISDTLFSADALKDIGITLHSSVTTDAQILGRSLISGSGHHRAVSNIITILEYRNEQGEILYAIIPGDTNLVGRVLSEHSVEGTLIDRIKLKGVMK
jgi:hypothetical protein